MESSEEDSLDRESARIADYLDLLERQMRTPRANRGWGAFDELAETAGNFNLILDVNEPDARGKPLRETARIFGQLLRQQQPVGGMSGQVNQTLIRQFRMPGYPLVLITTDLLQEGEDLHTFCSSVHHYGIAWTSSSMEQRIGRVDRVRSHTERRIGTIQGRPLQGDDMLQVYFPHLVDTVEVLQVQRVLERMNVFLQLMHEGLVLCGTEERTIDAKREFVRRRNIVPQIRERLKTAFPINPDQFGKERHHLAVGPDVTEHLSQQFGGIVKAQLRGLDVSWERPVESGVLLGTAHLGNRIQPFSLILKSADARTAVKCVSPVGCVAPGHAQDQVVASAAVEPTCIGAILSQEERTYDLTVEGGVLLAGEEEIDLKRIAMLVHRVVHQADALEQEYLPGRDQWLEIFRSELNQEATHGR